MDYKKYSSNRDVISLFSGAMGLDLGLIKAGLTVKVGQDYDDSCVQTMQANGHSVIPGNIQEIDPQELLNVANLSVGEPFLICGGPPCQPFSTAGKRLGINDPRGSLFMDFIRMIDYIKPRFFIMENVKGLISAPLKHVPISERTKDDLEYEKRPGTVLDVVLSEFKKLGYSTVYGVLDAVNYGVPQLKVLSISSKVTNNTSDPRANKIVVTMKVDLCHEVSPAGIPIITWVQKTYNQSLYPFMYT